MNFNIDASFGEMEELFEELGSKIFPDVELSAMNDAVKQSRTKIIRKVKEKTGVPVKVLRRRAIIHKAKRRRPSACLFLGTVPVAILPHLKAKVGARKSRRGGVSYNGPNGCIREPSGFITDTRYGVKAFKRKGKERMPLRHLAVDIGPDVRRAVAEVLPEYGGILERLFASVQPWRHHPRRRVTCRC